MRTKSRRAARKLRFSSSATFASSYDTFVTSLVNKFWKKCKCFWWYVWTQSSLLFLACCDVVWVKIQLCRPQIRIPLLPIWVKSVKQACHAKFTVTMQTLQQLQHSRLLSIVSQFYSQPVQACTHFYKVKHRDSKCDFLKKKTICYIGWHFGMFSSRWHNVLTLISAQNCYKKALQKYAAGITFGSLTSFLCVEF